MSTETFDGWLLSKTIAVCIPCLNEELTIGQVVKDFQESLPQAHILVYDNNSTDKTAEIAQAAGAEIRTVRRRGKGYVVRRIFNERDDDLVILVDGDSTYPAEAIMDLLEHQFKTPRGMVVGSREHKAAAGAFRPLHSLGNHLISWLVGRSFNYPVDDVLSGYRVLPRAIYKSLVLNSEAFDIETELTLQVLALKHPIVEVLTSYRSRPKDSHSKLNTWGDGLLILRTIALLVRYYRPLFFFNIMSFIFVLLGLAAGSVPILDYIKFQYVYHVPLALLAASLEIVAVIFFAVGLILDSIRYYHQIEMKKLNRDEKFD